MHGVILQKDTNEILNIDQIGSSTNTSITKFGPGIRNYYIIHFVFSGKGYFNGHPVSSGQGFLITPGMYEQYYSDSKNPWGFLWIISKDPKMKEIFDLFETDENNIFNYDYTAKIEQSHAFLKTNKSKAYSSYEMLEFFFSIIKYQQNNKSKNTESSNAIVYVEYAKKYINSNINKPITVSDITAFLGVSQPYLYKIFIEQTTKSPKDYILSKKLLYAKSLLEKTDISIAHVANSVGFQDSLMFSKFFRSKTGISPSNYRNQLKHI